jgi:hypothetical protein
MQFFRHRRRDPVDPASPSRPPAGPPDERDAYAAGVRQGLREARARRRGHPVLGLLVALVAVAGAAMLALAAHEGSFSRGGQVVDQNLSVAADQAKSAGADAVSKTGQAIENAGAAIAPKSSGSPSQ